VLFCVVHPKETLSGVFVAMVVVMNVENAVAFGRRCGLYGAVGRRRGGLGSFSRVASGDEGWLFGSWIVMRTGMAAPERVPFFGNGVTSFVGKVEVLSLSARWTAFSKRMRFKVSGVQCF
jgi:hypothetical protein